MKVKMTVEEIRNHRLDLWEKVCKMKRISVWALNEGQIRRDEEIEFTEAEARELGIVQ